MESPFPDWAGPLSRFLFSVPQWVMVGGIVLAAIVFLALATFVWLRREALAAGWRARGRSFKTTAIAALALIALVTTGLGVQSWSFMQHDNDFCQSCHIMDVPFEKFTTSEHNDLGCHACHQQPISASLRQVYLWILDRPEDIGEHAPVPNAVCAECHIQQRADSVWQRIVATAGHRVHLESDSLPELMCVKCHGLEVHRFVPVDQTCGQSGCHDPDKTQIVLGSMAGQNDLHCVACHQFTAPVSEQAAVDTARAALVPHQEQCFSCHDMEEQLVSFDPALEPHDAVCGTCHNPHTQESPEQARESCASGACHDRADTLTPFHRGLPDGVAQDCSACHRAHEFVVDGENCVACHADVSGDATPGARAGAVPVHLAGGAVAARLRGDDGEAVRGVYLELRGSARGGSFRQVQAGFDHRSHATIACESCHSFASTHGEITARTERDCMACHHTEPVVSRGCQGCHGGSGPGVVPAPLTLRLPAWPAPRTRQVAFDHAAHREVTCATCHVDGIARRTSRTCQSCHSEHHVATADCTTCHEQPPTGTHTIAVHAQGCAGSACHEDASLTTMPRTRSLCLSCHQDMEDHRPGRTCADCHRVPDVGVGAR